MLKIWHQSFTDLTRFPKYQETLQSHANSVMGDKVSVTIHGLMPGTYPADTAPMDFNSRAGLRLLNAQQVCEAALTAEAAGYDAFALGCFFDPALYEARSLVDIPVVSLTESCMLTACSLGRKFAVISLTDFQKMLTEDLAAQYGLASRLAGVVAMSPGVRLFDLEAGGDVAESIKERFAVACSEALRMGAEVIIPGDGVLNAFLVRHGVMQHEGAAIMDPLGVLFHHAAFFVQAKAAGCLDTSRRLLYAKPAAGMMEHAVAISRYTVRSEADFSGPAAHPATTT